MGELTGTTFAGLEVGDAIGQDLVSTIYEAVESPGDRVVALRVVSEDLCDPDGMDRRLYDRFLRRAGAALTFSHPHAPPVEEVGEHRGRGYLISTHIDTVPFADYIEDHGPLDVDAAAALCSQVADVLDAGHRAGLTHGAVNPSTLRVVVPIDDATPDVRLTGFGVGSLLELRLRRDRRKLREVDELLYVAPEQLRQQPLTGRTDQYAMACMLVHALTGSPPFVRATVGGLFGAHLFVAPSFDDPTAADAAIIKALAKEPRERYATCGQMVADVTRAERSANNRRLSARRRRESVAHDWSPDATVAPVTGTTTSTLDADGSDRGIVIADAGEPADAPAVSTIADAPDPAPPASADSVAPAPSDYTAVAGVDVPASSAVNGTAADPVRPAPAPADRAASALSNGEPPAAPQPHAAAAAHEKSSTAGPRTAGMAYPSTEDEAEPEPATDAEADLDDVPLLSEVLSRRPLTQRPAASSISGALVALIILAAVATAVALWFVVS